MSKSRKKRDCGCGSQNVTIVDPKSISRNRSCGREGALFTIDIKRLLIALAEDEDDENRVDIVLNACPSYCFIEDAEVIAVMDNTVVIREDNGFRFICISCICEVIAECDTIIDSLFDQDSFNR